MQTQIIEPQSEKMALSFKPAPQCGDDEGRRKRQKEVQDLRNRTPFEFTVSVDCSVSGVFGKRLPGEEVTLQDAGGDHAAMVKLVQRDVLIQIPKTEVAARTSCKSARYVAARSLVTRMGILVEGQSIGEQHLHIAPAEEYRDDSGKLHRGHTGLDGGFQLLELVRRGLVIDRGDAFGPAVTLTRCPSGCEFFQRHDREPSGPSELREWQASLGFTPEPQAPKGKAA